MSDAILSANASPGTGFLNREKVPLIATSDSQCRCVLREASQQDRRQLWMIPVRQFDESDPLLPGIDRSLTMQSTRPPDRSNDRASSAEPVAVTA